MAIWGWALLGGKAYGYSWHKIRAVKSIGRAGFVRHYTACNLTIAGRDVESGPRPTGEPVCSECLSAPD